MGNSVRAVLIVTIALLAVGCTGKYKKQVSDKDAQIAQLQTRVKNLEGKLEDEEKRAEELSDELSKALAEYREKEQVWLEQKDRRAIITLSEEVLFGSGNADLSDTGSEVVDRIAEVLRDHPGRSIMVEGHTDNVPIGANIKDRFQSNWELSSGRACSVLRYLYWKHKLEPTHLSAIGYGEFRPIADNDTSDGRARNRRVVIVVGPSAD